MSSDDEPKKKSRRNKKGPTGFEDGFTEPLLSAEQAKEEADELYASTVPFPVRIQICIDRYRKSRRMNTALAQYFQEYMFLGGIDVSAKPFHEEGAETAATISMQNKNPADGHVEFSGRFFDGQDKRWTVDFAGVAAGFFSVSLPLLTGLDDDAIIEAVAVVENFLHYVIYHKVCPEFTDDIQRALKIAADAKVEWRLLAQFESMVPGRFNLAAAELFGVSSSQDWDLSLFQRPEDFDPRKVFYSVLALLGEKELFASLTEATPVVVREIQCSLQLTKVVRPTDELVGMFRSLTVGEGQNVTYVLPVGVAKFTITTLEDGWYDPVEEENGVQDQEITLFLELVLLALLKPGMKLKVCLCQLDSGFYFLKSLVGIYPTFYTFLPQQLMQHFVPPQRNHRPGPSVHDGHDIVEDSGS